MSRPYIAKALREQVAKQAHHRCGYCLTSEEIVGALMEVDHIIPVSLGGQTVEDNLWLMCSLCNKHKGNRVFATDPETGEIAPLFDAGHQVWNDHFSWAENGEIIAGTTSTGRATVSALQLNRAIRVVARKKWVQAGWHPPKDEDE